MCFVNLVNKLIRKKICINNFYEDNIYKYEYNNICYETCLNKSHNSTKNNYSSELNCIVKNKTYSIESNIFIFILLINIIIIFTFIFCFY